jgi:hypothetical protein
MSEYEKYFISLPDRSNARSISSGTHKRFDDNETDAGMQINAEWGAFVNHLEMALIPDYDISVLGWRNDYANKLLQELRMDFIADGNRIIPNDRELTYWMKKHYGVNSYVSDVISI